MTKEELEKGNELMREYDCLESFLHYIEEILKDNYHGININIKNTLIECIKKEVRKTQKEIDDKFKNIGKYDF